MSGTWMILSIMLSLSLAFFLAAPLAEVAGAAGLDSNKAHDRVGRLLDAKERALRALKDLELDYNMGKVSQDDFERSKHELTREVGQLLEELRRHE
jgi:hypothetical protein